MRIIVRLIFQLIYNKYNSILYIILYSKSRGILSDFNTHFTIQIIGIIVQLRMLSLSCYHSEGKHKVND